MRFRFLIVAGLLAGCSDAPTQPAALPLSIGPIRAEREGRDMVFTAYVRNHQSDTALYVVNGITRGLNVIVREPNNSQYYVWRSDDLKPVIMAGFLTRILPRDSIQLSVRWTAVAEPGLYELNAEFLTSDGEILSRTESWRPLEIRLPSAAIAN